MPYIYLTATVIILVVIYLMVTAKDDALSEDSVRYWTRRDQSERIHKGGVL